MGASWCYAPQTTAEPVAPAPPAPPAPPVELKALGVHEVKNETESFRAAFEYEVDTDSFLVHATEDFAVFRYFSGEKRWIYIRDGSYLVRFRDLKTGVLNEYYTNLEGVLTKYTAPARGAHLSDSETNLVICPAQGWSGSTLVANIRQMRKDARSVASAPVQAVVVT